MTHTTRRVRTLTMALLLALPAVSEAGPPLICHPFQTGTEAVLPWGDGSSWNTPDTKYDVGRLTGDTLRLLSRGRPLIARMENLRRATIYAAKDPRVANELLSAVLARALASAATGTPDAEALFDAGYLLETYKQATDAAPSEPARGSRCRALDDAKRPGRRRVRDGHAGHGAVALERRDGVRGVADEGWRRLRGASPARRGERSCGIAPRAEPRALMTQMEHRSRRLRRLRRFILVAPRTSWNPCHLRHLRNHLRAAVRSLAAARGFSTIAIATLATGIALCVTVVTVDDPDP